MRTFFILIYIISFIILFPRCRKDEITISQNNPSSQTIKIKVTYSGTAKSFDKHKLYFLVNYGSNTQYNNFYFLETYGQLYNGATFTSPYKFEPGAYQLSGFWDWNDSGTWESYEPALLPQTFEVTGFSQTEVDMILQDKTSPNDNGWVQGGISYSGSIHGSHNVYVEITKESQYLGVFQIENYPFNFPSNGLAYSTQYLSPDIYMFKFFWDVDDNGYYNDNEPMMVLAGINVYPGLPTIENIILN